MHVTVLGCGYVGLELGRQLRDGGHAVLGVRRSADGLAAVRDAGLDAARADVTDAASLASLPDTDAVVFAASAGGRDAAAARAVYVDGLRTAVEVYGNRASPPDRLVYTSSTGVYGDHGGDWVDEDTPLDPATDRTRALVAAERLAGEAASLDATVVRFGGLYGPDRYRLSRYLEGPVTEGYLNLIHRVDAAGVVRHLFETGATPDTLVAVDDEPVAKADLARWLASACGVDPPETRSVTERLAAEDVPDARARRLRASKRCANDRLHALGYEFTYPTFREGYEPAVAAYRDRA
ncbi:MAG: SDR family oxidoreductase [Halobacteriaceae archaeon]